MRHTVLTGIKPTGTIHIGNYFGAIKPSIDMANSDENDYFYFIADYHALNTITNASKLGQLTREIACAWLACGLDPKKVFFYRQSDLPQVFELCSILTNITPKGLMNRAHAYKEALDNNLKNDKSADENINMGLYCYPILMASDIMLFNADIVPVGKDQTQHIEMAREMARSFNALFGKGKKNEILVEPNEKITESVAIIHGLDGRKMSKSYNNVVPLFCSETELKKLIKSIKTDSTPVNEPKSTDCTLFEYYKLFASKDDVEKMRKRFDEGVGYGEVKNELFISANKMLAPLREKYDYYMQNLSIVDNLLKDGAERVRPIAEKTMQRVRKAIITY